MPLAKRIEAPYGLRGKSYSS